jgi:enoyl-CoA hydratase/carnithine racemase
MEEALRTAHLLLRRSGQALAVIKAAVHQLGDMTQDAAFHAEALYGQQAFAGDDAREGLSAFADRRPPVFPSRAMLAR